MTKQPIKGDAVADPFETLESACAYAWDAYNVKDWAASFDRWSRIRDIWPDYPPPYVHAAASLLEAGDIKGCIAMLKAGLDLFPLNAEILTNYSLALLRQSDFAGASAVLENALGHFPDNPEIAVILLKIAIDTEDYGGALRRAELINLHYPGLSERDNGMREMVSHARLCFSMESIHEEKSSALNQNDPESIDLDLKQQPSEIQTLMNSFESLGENCEFGLVQRHFGVEPLGLLRWTATSVSNLTTALNEDFSGVGNPEQTRLIEVGTEYMTADNQYGMGSHTFVKINKEREQQIWKNLTQRLRYLKRKMLEDLKDGERIFVYHSEAGITPVEISGLHEAICRHGSTFLLCVLKADVEYSPGTLRDLGGGLMLGYIERLGPDRRPEGDFWNPAYDTWVDLCRRAYLACKDHHPALSRE